MQNETSSQDVEQQPSQNSTPIPLPPHQPNSIPASCICDEGKQTDISTLENRIKSGEIWMICLTAAISIITLFGVVVAYLQWTAMRDQMNEMRSQFQRDQRPYVMPAKIDPYPFDAGKPIIANLYWVNYGKSPAIKVSGHGAIFFGVNAREQADRWFELIEASNPLSSVPERIIPPGIPSNLKEAEFSTLSTKRAINQDELDFLTKNDFSIIVVSRQVYFDGVGNRYWTDSCFSNLATMAIPHCPKHNEIH